MLRDEFQLVLYASVVNSTWNPIAVTVEIVIEKTQHLNDLYEFCSLLMCMGQY